MSYDKNTNFSRFEFKTVSKQRNKQKWSSREKKPETVETLEDSYNFSKGI